MAPRGERRTQDLSDQPRLGVDLRFTEAEHLEAPRAQVQVACSVVLERLTPTVVAIAIRLNDETSIAPEEIDQMWADAHVDLWRRQPVDLAKPQEISLQVAASAIAAKPEADRKPEYRRLTDRAPQHLGGNHAAQIVNGPSGRGDRDSQASRHRAPMKRGATMQPDAVLPLPSSPTGNGDVDQPLSRLQQLPQSRGALMAHNGIIAIRQGGGHPFSLDRDSGIADRVDATVNPMQPAALHAPLQPASGNACFAKLLDGQDAVLPGRNSRRAPVRSVAFYTYAMHKATRARFTPGESLRCASRRAAG